MKNYKLANKLQFALNSSLDQDGAISQRQTQPVSLDISKVFPATTSREETINRSLHLGKSNTFLSQQQPQIPQTTRAQYSICPKKEDVQYLLRNRAGLPESKNLNSSFEYHHLLRGHSQKIKQRLDNQRLFNHLQQSMASNDNIVKEADPKLVQNLQISQTGSSSFQGAAFESTSSRKSMSQFKKAFPKKRYLPSKIHPSINEDLFTQQETLDLPARFSELQNTQNTMKDSGLKKHQGSIDSFDQVVGGVASAFQNYSNQSNFFSKRSKMQKRNKNYFLHSQRGSRISKLEKRSLPPSLNQTSLHLKTYREPRGSQPDRIQGQEYELSHKRKKASSPSIDSIQQSSISSPAKKLDMMGSRDEFKPIVEIRGRNRVKQNHAKKQISLKMFNTSLESSSISQTDRQKTVRAKNHLKNFATQNTAQSKESLPGSVKSGIADEKSKLKAASRLTTIQKEHRVQPERRTSKEKSREPSRGKADPKDAREVQKLNQLKKLKSLAGSSHLKMPPVVKKEESRNSIHTKQALSARGSDLNASGQHILNIQVPHKLHHHHHHHHLTHRGDKSHSFGSPSALQNFINQSKAVKVTDHSHPEETTSMNRDMNALNFSSKPIKESLDFLKLNINLINYDANHLLRQLDPKAVHRKRNVRLTTDQSQDSPGKDAGGNEDEAEGQAQAHNDGAALLPLGTHLQLKSHYSTYLDLLPDKIIFCAFNIADVLDYQQYTVKGKGQCTLRLPIRFIVREVPSAQKHLENVDLKVCLSMNNQYPTSASVHKILNEKRIQRLTLKLTKDELEEEKKEIVDKVFKFQNMPLIDVKRTRSTKKSTSPIPEEGGLVIGPFGNQFNRLHQTFPNVIYMSFQMQKTLRNKIGSSPSEMFMSPHNIGMRRIEIKPVFMEKIHIQKSEEDSDSDHGFNSKASKNSQYLTRLRAELKELNKDLEFHQQKSFEEYCIDLLQEYVRTERRKERAKYLRKKRAAQENKDLFLTDLKELSMLDPIDPMTKDAIIKRAREKRDRLLEEQREQKIRYQNRWDEYRVKKDEMFEHYKHLLAKMKMVKTWMVAILQRHFYATIYENYNTQRYQYRRHFAKLLMGIRLKIFFKHVHCRKYGSKMHQRNRNYVRRGLTFIGLMRNSNLEQTQRPHRKIYEVLFQWKTIQLLKTKFSAFMSSALNIQSRLSKLWPIHHQRSSFLRAFAKDEVDRLLEHLEHKRKIFKGNHSKKAVVGGFTLDKLNKLVKNLARVCDQDKRRQMLGIIQEPDSPEATATENRDRYTFLNNLDYQCKEYRNYLFYNNLISFHKSLILESENKMKILRIVSEVLCGEIKIETEQGTIKRKAEEDGVATPQVFCLLDIVSQSTKFAARQIELNKIEVERLQYQIKKHTTVIHQVHIKKTQEKEERTFRINQFIAETQESYAKIQSMRPRIEHKVRFDLEEGKSSQSPFSPLRSRVTSTVSGSIKSPQFSKSPSVKSPLSSKSPSQSHTGTRVLQQPEPTLPQFPKYPKFEIIGSQENSQASQQQDSMKNSQSISQQESENYDAGVQDEFLAQRMPTQLEKFYISLKQQQKSNEYYIKADSSNNSTIISIESDIEEKKQNARIDQLGFLTEQQKALANKQRQNKLLEVKLRKIHSKVNKLIYFHILRIDTSQRKIAFLRKMLQGMHYSLFESKHKKKHELNPVAYGEYIKTLPSLCEKYVTFAREKAAHIIYENNFLRELQQKREASDHGGSNSSHLSTQIQPVSNVPLRIDNNSSFLESTSDAKSSVSIRSFKRRRYSIIRSPPKKSSQPTSGRTSKAHRKSGSTFKNLSSIRSPKGGHKNKRQIVISKLSSIANNDHKLTDISSIAEESPDLKPRAPMDRINFQQSVDTQNLSKLTFSLLQSKEQELKSSASATRHKLTKTKTIGDVSGLMKRSGKDDNFSTQLQEILNFFKVDSEYIFDLKAEGEFQKILEVISNNHKMTKNDPNDIDDNILKIIQGQNILKLGLKMKKLVVMYKYLQKRRFGKEKKGLTFKINLSEIHSLILNSMTHH